MRVCKCADVDVGQVRGVDGVMLTTANLHDVTAAAGTMTSLNVEQHSLFMETITVGYGEVRVCVCERERARVRVCARACMHACARACVPSSVVSKPWSCMTICGRASCTPRPDKHNCNW